MFTFLSVLSPGTFSYEHCRVLLARKSAGSMLVRCENNVHDRNGSITQKIFFVRQHELRITFLRIEKKTMCKGNIFLENIFRQAVTSTYLLYRLPVCADASFFAFTCDLDGPRKPANVYIG